MGFYYEYERCGALSRPAVAPAMARDELEPRTSTP